MYLKSSAFNSHSSNCWTTKLWRQGETFTPSASCVHTHKQWGLQHFGYWLLGQSHICEFAEGLQRRGRNNGYQRVHKSMEPLQAEKTVYWPPPLLRAQHVWLFKLFPITSHYKSQTLFRTFLVSHHPSFVPVVYRFLWLFQFLLSFQNRTTFVV